MSDPDSTKLRDEYPEPDTFTRGEYDAAQHAGDLDSAATSPEATAERTKPSGGGRLLDLLQRSPKPWQRNANCMDVDPDLFFPERGASTREAKEVCRGCVVREDCLEYALANGEKFGIWGGLSERERRRIRRRRAMERRVGQTAVDRAPPETSGE